MLQAFLATSRANAGLAELLQGYDLACEFEAPRWDFAVDLATLVAAGLSPHLLRALMLKSHVEHGIEVDPRKDERRSFDRPASWQFRKRSNFILSDGGAEFVRPICQSTPTEVHVGIPSTAEILAETNGAVELKPRWNADRRELVFNGTVVIEFKRAAANMQALLDAFEKAGWARRINNPFDDDFDCSAKNRMHNAINALNRRQVVKILVFSGDGVAGGAEWRANIRGAKARRTRSRSPQLRHDRPARGVRVGNSSR